MGPLKMYHPKITEQSPTRRVRNFDEVCQGLTRRGAMEEARRCPQCAEPHCRSGCPLGIDIPGFIRFLREGDAAGALARLQENNPFGNICGRLCLAPCEKACVLSADGAAISIRSLERFASDHGQPKFYLARPKAAVAMGKKVAVVGSGVAGLMVSRMLAHKNYRVVVFEALPTLGGVLRYGVPEFRLPHKILDREVEALQALGVEFRSNHFIGHSLTLEDILSQGFACTILATGTGGAELVRIPGADLGSVYYAEEILMNVNLSSTQDLRNKAFAREGKRCVVIGRNYSALDCARVAVRLGKETTLVFDATEDDIDIYPQDLVQAQEEGIKFLPLTRTLEIKSNDGLLASGVKCMTLDFADPDSSGKWELLPVPESETVLDADMVILSLGHRVNTSLPQAIPGLKSNADGTVWFTEEHKTSLANVLVAGDAETGASSIVHAMASGKTIAQVVDQYLSQA